MDSNILASGSPSRPILPTMPYYSTFLWINIRKIVEQAFCYFCNVKVLFRPFFIGYFILLVSCIILLMFTEKLILHLEINLLNSPWLDQIMPYITFLGDGIFAIIIATVFLLWINRKWGWMLLLCYGISSILAQATKHFMFPESMRPYFHLKSNPSFHQIPGLFYHEFHSFPSGHTTTAFAIATYLSLAIKPSISREMTLLFMATLVGFSRIYLSQHFLIDVVFGSLLGTLCSFSLYYLLPSSWLRIETPYLRR